MHTYISREELKIGQTVGLGKRSGGECYIKNLAKITKLTKYYVWVVEPTLNMEYKFYILGNRSTKTDKRIYILTNEEIKHFEKKHKEEKVLREKELDRLCNLRRDPKYQIANYILCFSEEELMNKLTLDQLTTIQGWLQTNHGHNNQKL